ncbi:transposase [Ammoniphilus sp. CFH 90114]|uniref:IS1/IS1595 family N-terminal zinc-binding domain-containing protein n=1 Tax=Ammoniphilus sp. CFH 90114 TaxID=2493665 RepID=UPI0013E93958|nr:transposase [Ammoniphilus sp. CFH 90114]
MKKNRLLEFAHRFTDEPSCRQLLGQVKEKKQAAPCCPHCESSSVVRYGKYRDRQRYKCKACLRTFNDFTNTPLHGTHFPHKWIKFLECLMDGSSLQFSAMKVGVSYVTLFYWRHKIIHALDKIDQLKSPRHQKVTYPEDNQGYIWVYFYPPTYKVYEYEQRPFTIWIGWFIGIGRKYLDRYVSWFRFVHKNKSDFRVEPLEVMSKLLLQACSISLGQTYDSVKNIAAA